MEGNPVPQAEYKLYLDAEDALKRMGGNKAILTTLLKKFINGSEEEKLKAALADYSAQNFADAKAAAHAIKGLAANLSMPALREAAFNLEMTVKEGGDLGVLPEAVYQARAKTVFVIEAMLASGGF
jgi:HPt (histidine-containing phosphotransfer) domain-containing protein